MSVPRVASLVAAAVAVATAPASAQHHPDRLGWRFVGTAGYVQPGGNISETLDATFSTSRPFTFQAGP
jgi:hypothetical protein